MLAWSCRAHLRPRPCPAGRTRRNRMSCWCSHKSAGLDYPELCNSLRGTVPKPGKRSTLAVVILHGRVQPRSRLQWRTRDCLAPSRSVAICAKSPIFHTWQSNISARTYTAVVPPGEKCTGGRCERVFSEPSLCQVGATAVHLFPDNVFQTLPPYSDVAAGHDTNRSFFTSPVFPSTVPFCRSHESQTQRHQHLSLQAASDKIATY